METEYFVVIGKQRKGPFTKSQLIGEGLQPDSLVWFEGCADWRPAAQVPELADLFGMSAGLTPAKPADAVRRLYSEAYLHIPCRIGEALYYSAWFFFSCSLILYLFSLFENGPIIAGRDTPRSIVLASAAFGLGFLCVAAANIGFLIFLYRSWKVIQDGHARHSAGAAVGFLFIPVFQFYWIFVATSGLAHELHRYAIRRRLKAPRPSVLLGVAVAFYAVLGLVPVIGSVAWLINLVLAPFFMQSIYETARCFCVENLRTEEDESALRRPVMGPHALGAGLFAILLAPIALLACLSGSLATPAPYAALLRWNPAPAKAQPIRGGPDRFEQRGQIQELKDNLAGGDFHGPHVVAICVISLFGALLLFFVFVCAQSARRANADQADEGAAKETIAEGQ
jgi:hypothetical protein